jgi:hypothetical protein
MSQPKKVRVTNKKGKKGKNQLPVMIMSVTPSVGFMVSSDGCSMTTLAAGQSCSFQATFDATSKVTVHGTITINDNAIGSPQTVTTVGTGK